MSRRVLLKRSPETGFTRWWAPALSANLEYGGNDLKMTNILSYHDTEAITAVNWYLVTAPGHMQYADELFTEANNDLIVCLTPVSILQSNLLLALRS
jgi:hypothetical protein